MTYIADAAISNQYPEVLRSNLYCNDMWIRIHQASLDAQSYKSVLIIMASLKLSAMFRYCYLQSYHKKTYANEIVTQNRNTRCWHYTTTVQGIRNDN